MLQACILKAKCISGDDISYTGPNGLAAANTSFSRVVNR